MHEAPYAERGVAAENWIYHQNCNFYSNDGIYSYKL